MACSQCAGIAGGIVALAIAIGVTGCVYTHERLIESGVHISEESLAQVEVGRTKRLWIIGAFGEPTSMSTISETPLIEIIRYEEVVERAEGSWFIVAGGDKQHSYSRNTFFELTDGVLTRFWRDAPVQSE